MKLPSAKVLVAALSVAFAAVPSHTIADHSWGDYHWARTSNPFTLKLGDNVSSQWDAALSTASADWSQSAVLRTAIVPGSSGKNCKATAGMVQVCNSTYGRNGWLGIAQIWASGTHIVQGTTKLNDTYFNTKTYNTPAWRALVMCQEVGHTFGLDHQDENFSNANLGTCMDYTNNPESNQHPNAHDYAQLETIYAHLDSSTTVTQAVQSGANLPREMTDNDFAEPHQWGKLIRSSKNGLKEVYMLDFGRGHKIFTFVTWVAGEERGHGREKH